MKKISLYTILATLILLTTMAVANDDPHCGCKITNAPTLTRIVILTVVNILIGSARI